VDRRPGAATHRVSNRRLAQPAEAGVGLVSVLPVGRGNALRRRAGAGSRWTGRALKKRAAHHDLRRRERIERAAAAGPALGAARADPGAAVALQLADARGRRRHDVLELLLPPLATRRAADSPSRGCPPMPRNSIRWKTLGGSGSIPRCPPSTRATSARAALRRAAPCGVCAAAPRCCDPARLKQHCHYNMQDSIGRNSDPATASVASSMIKIGQY
jgi:hypothetical protein